MNGDGEWPVTTSWPAFHSTWRSKRKPPSGKSRPPKGRTVPDLRGCEAKSASAAASRVRRAPHHERDERGNQDRPDVTVRPGNHEIRQHPVEERNRPRCGERASEEGKDHEEQDEVVRPHDR